GRKAHPTQKPEALLQRLLLATTMPGDVVLDPFFGTGTTGAVAKRLGRRWLGIEREEDYARAAEERIAVVDPLAGEDIAPLPTRRQAPRVSFGQVVELGLLRPGRTLFDPRREIRARVRADGMLTAAGASGSIHKLGAQVQNKAACNGWTFWHYAGSDGLTPIDVLRDEARRQLGLV
ncbi:MAG: site-specific DNA-methyltransferase, partial [Pseudomonadota bacterium]